MIYLTALLLGLGGSLHCVAMCGPIALALPLTQSEKMEVVRQSLIYQLGRVGCYSLIGGLFGCLGWGIALAGFQNWFSILLGLSFLCFGLFSYNLEKQIFRITFFKSFFENLKIKITRSLQINGSFTAFKIGFLNGLLPCGLVYVALAGSIATSHPLLGAFYMMLFGIGTIPMLLLFMVFRNQSKRFVSSFSQWIPVAMVAFGAFLIYRGFILEIPREITFWETSNFPIMCNFF